MKVPNVNKINRACAALAFAAAQIFSLAAQAMIPPMSHSSPTRPSFSISRDYSKGLDASIIQPIVSKRDIHSDDVAQIIPEDLKATNDQNLVATQILDHSVSSFFNSPNVRNSDFGRTATHVEKSMEGGVAFGGVQPHSIQHSFKFAMKATQAKALIEYSGLTNAQLSYSAVSQKTDLEVKEKLALNTQMVYNHTITPSDKLDMVSLRWIW